MKIQHISKKIKSYNNAALPLQFDNTSSNSRKLITEDKSNKILNKLDYFTASKCNVDSRTTAEWEFDKGNICIIGTDKDVFSLSCYIISYFEVRNHLLELVTSTQFLRAGRSDDFHNQNYLVHIDPANVSGNRVRAITDHCTTTFISHASSGIFVSNRIVGSLGKNFSKRRAMLNSLKQNEFLIIIKDNEMIFNLNDEV